jgi:Rho termination factor, N-terminal domain
LLRRFASSSQLAGAKGLDRVSSRLRAFWHAVSGRERNAGGGDLTRDELYAKARRLGIERRSSMTKHELAEAIRRREQRGWRQAALETRPLRRAAILLAALRGPLPVRHLALSLTVLAAGALGLLVAIAITPEAELHAQLLTAGQPVRIATVTGPGGATTVAVARTKDGETRLVPVRVVRTVTGPSDDVLRTEVRKLTDTEVVTRVEPVTVVVTNSEAVTVTETVVLEVTTTVPPGHTKTKP